MRGPGYPCVNLLAQQLFRFDPPRSSPLKDVPGDGSSNHQQSPHQPQEAKNVIDIGETKGLNSPQFPSPPQTMGLRAPRVCYQQLPQCLQGLTGQMDPDVPEEVDAIERKELI